MKRLTFLLIFTFFSAYAGEKFAKQYDVEVPKQINASELVKIPLIPTMYPDLRDDLNDLRLFSTEGKSVPFSIAQEYSHDDKFIWKFEPLNVSDVVLIEDSLSVTLRSRKPIDLSALRIKTVLRDFEFSVKVHNKDGALLLDNGDIFDYSSYADSRKELIEFATVNTNEVEAVITGLKKLQKKEYYALKESFNDLTGSGVEKSSRLRQLKPRFQFASGVKMLTVDRKLSFSTIDVATNLFTVKDTKEKTVIDIKPQLVPVTGISLNVDDNNFSREIRVSTVTENSATLIFSGRLESWSYRKYLKKLNNIRFREVKANLIRVEILNTGKTPLTIKGLQLLRSNYALYYLHESDKKYVVQYNNPELFSSESHTKLPSKLLQSGRNNLLTGKLTNLKELQHCETASSTINKTALIYTLTTLIILFLIWVIVGTVKKAEKIVE